MGYSFHVHNFNVSLWGVSTWCGRYMCLGVFVRISIAVKKHHDQDNSDNIKHLIEWLTVSEVQSLIIMVGHCSVRANMVPEKELRILHFGL